MPVDVDKWRAKSRVAFQYISGLDMFRVVQDRDRHLTPATTHGSILSTAATGIIAVLVILEVVGFFMGDIRSSMFVPSDPSLSEPLEAVHLRVSFPEMPCTTVGIVVVDEHCQPQIQLMRPSSLSLFRLAPGNYKKTLGLYTGGRVGNDEGCRVEGHIMIDKVPGHFLVGSLKQQQFPPPSNHHIIHDMWIGEKKLDYIHDHLREDVVSPLKGVAHLSEPAGTVYKYYLQIVPTYFRKEGKSKPSKVGYQMTATASNVLIPQMPSALYFTHKHTALAIEYRYRYETWSHFVVSLCAIAGGVYTVMGFLVRAVDMLLEYPSVAGLWNQFLKSVRGK